MHRDESGFAWRFDIFAEASLNFRIRIPVRGSPSSKTEDALRGQKAIAIGEFAPIAKKAGAVVLAAIVIL